MRRRVGRRATIDAVMSRGTLARLARTASLHLRRQAVGYVALAVALGGSAYAGSKGGSQQVGAKDLRPVVERLGESVTVQPGDNGRAEAECKRRERALVPAGGGGFIGGDGAVVLQALGLIVKDGKAKRAFVEGFNISSNPQPLAAHVLCLRP
jgi:hypothetical protein